MKTHKELLLQASKPWKGVRPFKGILVLLFFIPLLFLCSFQTSGVKDSPVIQEITVSELKTAIQNYTAGTYTIFKVTGQMTNEDYNEVITLVESKLAEWDYEKLIGLDLSEVTGLTRVKRIYYFSSLTIPNTITQFYFDLLLGIQIRPDNPYFVWDDGVLYSKDKTILYLYSSDKKDDKFEIPSGVKSIYPFAFEEAGNLKEITIPESLTNIGYRAFFKQKLVFKNKQNWISDRTGKVLTAEELENPENYYYFNPETHIEGICRNGIYKPVTKTVSVQNLEEAIKSASPYIHTVFKINGKITSDDYSKFVDCVVRKAIDEDWIAGLKGSIGFDLTEVTGLTEITSVGDFVFSLAIPDTVTTITYLNSQSVISVTNITDNPNFTYEDEVLYSKDKTILYAYPMIKENQTFTIPSTVTKINSGAFYVNFYIKDIIIPESVVYIGHDNFTYSDIKTLTFENKKDWETCYSHKALTEFELENPDNYKYGSLCAKGICKSGAEERNEQDTGNGSGSVTETVIIEASILVEALKNYKPQENVYTIFKVTGKMTNDKYQEAFDVVWEKINVIGWSEKYVGLDLSEVKGLTVIGGNWCFKSLIIPNSVTEIFDCTAGNILNLRNHPNFKYDENGILYTKDGLTICYYPEDKKAESFTIPDGVEKISYLAFERNSYLKYLTIPASVKYINNDAFNSALEELIFEDSENWYDVENNQPVSKTDLKNPSNYKWDGQLHWGAYKK